MPKVLTVKRRESEVDRAQEYVRTHILLPSAVLGLVFMVAGGGALISQFFSEGYGVRPFVYTTALFLVGATLGWGQTRYQRYLLQQFPFYFAGRMKLFSQGALKRPKREAVTQPLTHRGRAWIPMAYVLGVAALLGCSTWAAVVGQLYYLTAFFIPWVGFFWAKMFFWRSVLAVKSAG